MIRYFAYILLLISVQKEIYSQDYWISQISPTDKNLSTCFFSDTLNGWIGGDSGLILHTTNNGVSWNIQNSGVNNVITSIYFTDNFTGYALSFEFDNTPPSFYGTRILSTTDGGNIWNNYLFPDTGLFLNTVFFLDSENGFLGGSGGKLFYTNNSGNDWYRSAIDSGLDLGFPVEKIMFYNADTGYAVGGAFDIAGVIWQTTNGGKSWITKIVGPEPFYDLHIFDALNVIGIGGDFEYGTSKVRTSTGGAVWDYTELGIFGIANTIEFRTESEAWVSLGIIDSFLVTTNSGKSWRQTASPNSSRIYDICFSSSTNGWAVGVDGAILKFNAKTIGINNVNLNLPESVTLFQNYPNPFNPNTVISYELRSDNSNSSHVTLKIFDVLGKETATLVNERQYPGVHAVTFNGGDFHSGIYYYRISVTDEISGEVFSVSRKMTLIK